jgi:hypothetical protein
LIDAYEMRNALAHGYFKVDLKIVWFDSAFLVDSKASGTLGHPVRDGIPQHSIDTRLPTSASGLESLKHFSINTHIQGRALHAHARPASATRERGGFPVVAHRFRVFRVVRTQRVFNW